MYLMTTSASRLAAYRSESGSFSATRQNAVALVPEHGPAQVLGQEVGDTSGGVGGGQGDDVGHALDTRPPSPLGPCYRPPAPPGQLG